jgi:cytosine/adenosine deaminase-related metal-dependent hydrolase
LSASHILPITSPPIRDGAIAVDNGRIVAIGTLADLRSAYPGPVTEFPDLVIMPGLVNAHSHLELTHFSAWKIRKDIDYSPRTYADWVVQLVKLRRGVSSEELFLSLREGLWKSLESGTTAIGEIVTDRSLINVYANSPLSGRLYMEAVGHEPSRCASLSADLRSKLDLFEGGNFLPGLSPHTPHTLSQRFMQEIGAMAKERGVPTMIHLSESPEEVEFMYDSTGRIADLIYPLIGGESFLPPPRKTSSTAYLDGLGLLTPSTTVVHSVHVTPADMDILKKREVSVVLCPRSNDRLAVGRAPAALLKKSGIPLALGTDSLASNDTLSLWDEMRFLRNEFQGVFTPRETISMITDAAAKALHISHQAGALAQGMPANFLVMRLGSKVAVKELEEALIEEGRVEMVFVKGERQI